MSRQTVLLRDGYLQLPAAIDAALCTRLKAELPTPMGRAGLRDLMATSPLCRQLVLGELQALAAVYLPQAKPVRVLYFDKTPAVNWCVGWHQDLSIAVQARREWTGFTGWSRKAGVWHVQPPDAVLASMLTLRLHLDPTHAGNGALQVVPGSHRYGRLPVAECRAKVSQADIVCCEAAPGDILLMRPLLLHASAPSIQPFHRRVLHIEFAAAALPGGLAWHEFGETSEMRRVM
ncbi:phytanoyl-CoA dioxygenase family protein [Chitinivorax sp. B]|uniref:phytanoyl-CoA dioxygenase family protein n=1 Tax=Chitinivorax sp. B TaxID=2502235 RepID=UPI002017592E|nr:phytanoyl-CoA dioxygenase family protein [Chitinivorax sp. B]